MLDKVAQFCTPFVQTTIIISELTPYSSTAIIQPNPIPRAHTHRKTKRVANAALFVLWRYGTRMGPFFSSLTRTRSLRSLGGLRPLSPSGFAPIRFTCVLTQNETTPLRHFKKVLYICNQNLGICWVRFNREHGWDSRTVPLLYFSDTVSGWAAAPMAATNATDR